MLNKYLFLAIRNLRRRKLRAWLTMIGIFIGIAAVVSLISLGDGLREAITGQFSSLGTDKLTVTNAETSFGPPGSTAIKKLTQHDIDVIESVNGAEQVIPRILRPIEVEYNKETGYYFAVSMPNNPETIKEIYDAFSMSAETGRLLTATDRKKVLLGHEFSRDMSFGKEIRAGSILKIQGEDFEVVGILKPLSTFQVNLAVLMMEEDMVKVLDIEDEYDIFAVWVSEGYDTEEVAQAIKDKMRKDRNEKIGEEDFSVQTPANLFQSVNTFLNIINIVVIGIALISLLVGGIGIANTMYTSVLERTKEIGVMKAIGARNRDVLLIFLFESALLGFIGGLIGIVFGLGLAFGISAAVNSALGMSLFIVKLNSMLIGFSLAFSLVFGILFGVLPAMQASKLKPVDALRS